MQSTLSLHIAVKAENGAIYEELQEDITSAVHLAPIYDMLAGKIQLQLMKDETKVDPQDPEPKITLARTEFSQYSTLEEFAHALSFI